MTKVNFYSILFLLFGKVNRSYESKLKCSKSSLLLLIHLSHIHVHLTFHLHLHLLFFSVLASFVYDVLHILVSISSILIHILHIVLCLQHVLFFLHLLLHHSSLVFFLWHLILLLVTLWGILNKVSVLTCVHLNVVFSFWLSILWWWDVLTFVSVVKFDSL